VTTALSLVIPYYTNPGMLAVQYAAWTAYPAAVKAQIEIVLVDDGSPAAAMDVPRPAGLPALRIFRVLEDRLWHQHGARNLGANQAAGPWLLMTDMDHVVPAESMAQLLKVLERDRHDGFYTFHRLDAPDLAPKLLHGQPHPHQNTFAVSKARYWAAGGYNEDLCGFYGTDGYFLQRLVKGAEITHLVDVPVVRYSRDVIPDASTRADREAGRRRGDRQMVMSRRRPGVPSPVLQFPWIEVYSSLNEFYPSGGFVDFGSGVMATLHGRERVLTKGDA